MSNIANPPLQSAGKTPASITSKAPAKLTDGAKAAKKTTKAAALADGEKKKREMRSALTLYTNYVLFSPPNGSTLTLVSPTTGWPSITAS